MFQSATYLNDRRFEAPFGYLRAFEVMFDIGIPLARVLMLGGGGFAYPKHLLSHHGDVAIDVVEIDPQVIDTARSHFFLEEAEAQFGDRLCVYNIDAHTFLEETSLMYDAILCDLYCGSEPDSFFYSEAGFLLAKSRLARGGLLLSNIVVPDSEEGAHQLFTVAKTAARVFSRVALLDATDPEYSEDDNDLLIARNGTIDIDGAFYVDSAFDTVE